MLAEVVFDSSGAFPLFPLSTDYGSPVVYRTDEGIAPLANGTSLEALFRFSDNGSDVVEYWVPATGVDDAAWPASGSGLTLMASPNPTGGTAGVELLMPVAGEAHVGVYDVRGALVRALAWGWVGPGSHSLSWDGRDDAGRSVGSGVYFLKARALGRSSVRKLVLLR